MPGHHRDRPTGRPCGPGLISGGATPYSTVSSASTGSIASRALVVFLRGLLQNAGQPLELQADVAALRAEVLVGQQGFGQALAPLRGATPTRHGRIR
jgi:hypothetical protein